MNKRMLILLACAPLVLPASAIAMERGTFRLRATVKTVCRVEFSGLGGQVRDGAIDLGAMTRLCNDRGGYRLILQHAPGMAGTMFVIDGQAVPLSAGTETVLLDENHPVFKISSASLALRDGAGSIPSLSFRIEPKGQIF